MWEPSCRAAKVKTKQLQAWSLFMSCTTCARILGTLWTWLLSCRITYSEHIVHWNLLYKINLSENIFFPEVGELTFSIKGQIEFIKPPPRCPALCFDSSSRERSSRISQDFLLSQARRGSWRGCCRFWRLLLSRSVTLLCSPNLGVQHDGGLGAPLTCSRCPMTEWMHWSCCFASSLPQEQSNWYFIMGVNWY